MPKVSLDHRCLVSRAQEIYPQKNRLGVFDLSRGSGGQRGEEKKHSDGDVPHRGKE